MSSNFNDLYRDLVNESGHFGQDNLPSVAENAERDAGAASAIFDETSTAMADAQVEAIREQIGQIRNSAAKARIYVEEGVLESEVGLRQAENLEGLADKLEEVENKAMNVLRRSNEAVRSVFENMGKTVDNIITSGLAGRAKNIKKNAETLDKAATDASKVAKDAIADNAAKQEAWMEDQTNETKMKEWQDAAEKARESIAEREAAETASRIATDAADVIEKEVIGLTGSDVMYQANKLVKAMGVDITAAWAEVANVAKAASSSVELITDGYAKYYAKFLIDEENGSELWVKMRATSKKITAGEKKRLQKEAKVLMEAAKTEGDEAFMEAAAHFNAPSMRQIQLIADDLADARDLELGLYSGYRWIAFVVKSASRGGLIAAFAIVEKVIGKTAAAAIYDTALVVIEFAAKFLGKLFSPELMALKVGIEVVIDLIKHGFTWRFVDDLLGFVGLSLTQIDPYKQLQLYPKRSQIAGKKKVKELTNPLKMNEFDSIELATMLDYWGKIYIDELNHRGSKLPVYQKLKPFDAIRRVSGQYLKEGDTSLDLQSEIDQCKQIERDLEEGFIVGKDSNGIGGSLTAKWFPRKDGLIRNLLAFPAYETSFHWPNVNGDIIQKHGIFNEASLDPTLLRAFKGWLDAGTYGSVYNSNPHDKARNIAIATNKKDLAQWLDPKQSHPTWKIELGDWIDSNRGGTAVYSAEMLLLAPEIFEKEFGQVAPVPSRKIFDLEKEYQPGTLEYYMHEHDKAGRWLFYFENIQFYKQVFEHRIMRITDHYILHGPSRLRTATAEEIKFFKDVYDQGIRYKAYIATRKTMTEQQWLDIAYDAIWPIYVKTEKPFRTHFGYIARWQSFFKQDLIAICNVLLGDRRAKAWAQYTKIKARMHVPLNMNSAHRVLFMGKFTQLAFSTNVTKEKQIEDVLKKQFGKLLENDLVTTAPKKKGWMPSWMKLIKNVIEMDPKFLDKIPVTWGHINCRTFVLENPKVIVVSFEGTNPITEWKIDAKFMVADFVTATNNKKTGDVAYKKASKNLPLPGGFAALINHPDVLMINRGFMDAYSSIHKSLDKLLRGYMKKYDIEDVFLTGYGLGAALVQMCALRIPRLKYTDPITKEVKFKPPHCYMFASPNVGDTRFQDKFIEMAGETANIWNDGDISTAVPPFLIPAEDVTHQGYSDALKTFRSIGKNPIDNPFIGIAFGLGSVFENLGDWSSFLPGFAQGVKNYTREDLMQQASKIFHAMTRLRPGRGGGLFFRLDYNTKGNFEEVPEDPGNSNWLIQLLATSTDPKALMKDVHSMDSIMTNFAYIAQNDPDDFSLNNKDLPAWAGGGGIKPHRHPHRVFKDSTIIGFAHSKHHHKSYTVIKQSDIDETDMLLIPQKMSVNVGRAAKRHKHNLKDSSYHGSHYY